jgi:predicted phosphoribosyltransferase
MLYGIVKSLVSLQSIAPQQSTWGELKKFGLIILGTLPIYAIGLWYENFAQTTDEEVCELLNNQLVTI